jgi:hypothetical protein
MFCWFQAGMNNEDNQDRERYLRERIVCVMRAIEQTPKKQIAVEELQKLKAAASRLDQMLKAAAEADRQALRSAAARLDQMLSDIRSGKDITNELKLRRDSQNGEE